jgi:hypothetical protein
MPLPDMVYLPHLNQARIVKAYRFESSHFGSHCAVLLTECASASPVQYAHVLIVNQGAEIFGAQCFAVASEINKTAPPDSPRSHFLGVFPGVFGGAQHENLGADHAWADLGSFERHALALIAERFGVTQPPQEISITPEMARRYQLPQLHSFARDAQASNQRNPSSAKRRWEFWKK